MPPINRRVTAILPGPPGETGATGPQGPPGPAGAGGSYTYVRSFSVDGEPPDPAVNETWFDPDVGATYLRYDDGVSVSWMQSGAAASPLSSSLNIDGGNATSIYTGIDPFDGGGA